MSAHTPGPWLFVAEGTECDGVNVRYSVSSEDATSIASGQSQEHMADISGAILEGECIANARLIAAAPELLAALRDLIEQFEEHDERNREPECPVCYAVQQARAAIAKAVQQ